MARFSVGGDEDGNEDPPTNRPIPKRPRISYPIVYKRSAAADDSRDLPTTSAAVRLSELVVESERQTSDESGSSWSDSSTDSSSEEEEDNEEEEAAQQQQTQRSGNEGVNLTASGSDAGREPESSNTSVSVILSDPDVLDCPICCEALCSPVFQCENGHIACASCCTTMKNKCGTCSWPIGYNRCRAIEKVLDSVRVSCRNIKHGCKETFSYNKKHAHEKTCIFAPCSCPLIGCGFVSISKTVYSHFSLKHPESSKRFCFNEVISISLDRNQKHVYLQEKNLSTVFVLNRTVETVGSYLSVVCVAPTSEKRTFLYDLTATVGESSIKLKSFVEIMSKIAGAPKIYLIVPRDLIRVCGQLKLELTIWRNPVLNN